MLDVEERFALFRELAESVSLVYITEFDENYEIIYANNSESERFRKLFSFERAGSRLISMEEALRLVEADIRRPVVFTNRIGMTWLSDAQAEAGRIVRIFLLGPVFTEDYSLRRLEPLMERLELKMEIRQEYTELLRSLPVISMGKLCDLGIMLHQVVTGERITRLDFQYVDCYEDCVLPEESKLDFQALLGTEQKVCRMIEEGNKEYRKEQEKLFSFGDNIVRGDGGLRWAKAAAVMLCTLYVRAAIRGGVDAETAYTMGCVSIQQIETLGEIGAIQERVCDLADGFVRAVSRRRIQSGISPQIQKSCDYIGLHLQEAISIQYLAGKVGYKDYYFSNKFKREVGVSVREYIRKKRIERGKELLMTTNMDVQEISVALGFESISYFGEIFKRETGMSPGEYRRLK